MSAPIPLRPDVNASRNAAVASLVRASISTGLRTLDRSYGGPEKSWPGDRDVELILRTPQTPTSTTNATALAHVSTSFLSALVPFSASAALIDRSLKLSFNGAASISMPTLTLPLADFVGQGKPIPVVQGTSASGVTLEPHKLATIVPLTGEMLRTNAEAIVRQVLLDNVGPSLDAAMFSNAAAVPDLRPGGLLNGIAALTPSSGTNKAEAMTDDVAALATATAAVSGNGQIVLVAAPAQSVALMMRPPGAVPFPVLMSAALPAKRVIAIAARALVSAFDAPALDASRESAIHLADPAAELVDLGGILAQPVKSMVQTDSVALRLRLPCAWALRSPSALAWLDNVVW
jgi:hypothetical protein